MGYSGDACPIDPGEYLKSPTGYTDLAGTKYKIGNKIYMLVINGQGSGISGGEVVVHMAGYYRGEKVDLCDSSADGPVAGVVASDYGTNGVPTGALFLALRQGTINCLNGATKSTQSAAGWNVIADTAASDAVAGRITDIPAISSVSAGLQASMTALSIRNRMAVFARGLAASGGTAAATEAIFVDLEGLEGMWQKRATP